MALIPNGSPKHLEPIHLNLSFKKKFFFLTWVIMLLFTKLKHSKNKKEQVIPDFLPQH